MYPSEEFLEDIRHWNPKNFNNLFDYIKDFWLKNSGIIGCRIEDGEEIYELWTNSPYNEIIIGNLAINHDFWLLHWRMSCRGGYYEFSRRYTPVSEDYHNFIETYI